MKLFSQFKTVLSALLLGATLSASAATPDFEAAFVERLLAGPPGAVDPTDEAIARDNRQTGGKT